MLAKYQKMQVSMEKDKKDDNINYNLLTQKKLDQLNEEEYKKTEKENSEFKASINRLFHTHDGIVLGKWLLENCGLFETSIVLNKNDISQLSTFYNEARKSIYLELRRFFDADTIINLEIKNNNGE